MASNDARGQTVDWEIEDGNWSVVVMNADGSLGVDADISAGADLPFLNELGRTALGSGAFALVMGIGLIAVGIRRPNTPSGSPRSAARLPQRPRHKGPPPGRKARGRFRVPDSFSAES